MRKTSVLFFRSFDRSSVKCSGDDSFLIESNPNHSRSYLIYLKNDHSLFGELSYQIYGENNYLYRIVIGQKMYRVRSSDLLDRHLTILDTLQTRNSSCPGVLFQTNDAFSQLNRQFHLTINHLKWQYGYLALVILLILHEDQRIRW